MVVLNQGTVKTEEGGITYEANFTVWNGMISVYYLDWEKTCHLDGAAPKALARRLLCEIIAENRPAA